MAEEAKKKADAPEKAAAAPAEKAGEKKDVAKAAGGGLLTKMPVLIGGVMILEAVLLFAGFKFMGGGSPASAAGADLATSDETEKDPPADASHGGASGGASHGGAADSAGSSTTPSVDKKASIELAVVNGRFLNMQNGRRFLVDVEIVAVTKGANSERVDSTIKQRKNLILDRVRTIIGQSDPEKLGGSEPGLETLRRQVKYQLDDIVGEGMIEEVLVPRCIPFRTD